MNLTNALNALQSAEQQHKDAVGTHDNMAALYTGAIAGLQQQIASIEQAMKDDLDVQEAYDFALELDAGCKEALSLALSTTIKEWAEGKHTKKSWLQDGFNISLRETSVPIVTDANAALAHLEELGTLSVVKKTALTLNKKATVDLYRMLKNGIKGIEIQEEVTCSIKSVV